MESAALERERTSHMDVFQSMRKRRMHRLFTDEPVDGDIPDVTEPPETDIGFLLDVLCSVLHVPVRRDDVVGAFAGLRPLLDTTPEHADAPPRTADISRRHAVLTSPDGVVTDSTA